nr:pyrroline-5-carboxylate reductase [Mesorhizobium sp. YR577]
MENFPRILLVGCGKMGGALLSGVLDHGLEEAVVVTPRAVQLPATRARLTACRDISEVPEEFVPSVVVFATKPQFAPEIIPHYAHFVGGDTIFLSIMAGITTAGMCEMLGSAAPVVRAMPNTPAAIRQGFICAFAAKDVTPEQVELCDNLLAAVGEVAWVEKEGLLDPATAISGGGPAYVYLLAELLEAAAVEQGLPPAIARRMARVTVSGSGALLASSDADVAQLRTDVTSPGGTTEQALRILMAEDAWPRLVSEAVEAATARSRLLASGQTDQA